MYHVNEIFYSLQGEGIRAGTAATFVRFAGCNMRCQDLPGDRSPGGFTCDTEFQKVRWSGTAEELVRRVREVGSCEWVVLTGGEPALQVDSSLIAALKDGGFRLAIETNGTICLPHGIDWVTVSPKVPASQVQQWYADEVKCVVAHGDPIPTTNIRAHHKLLSPVFRGLRPDPDALEWCIHLVQQNPSWRLSVQQHKIWGIA